MKKLQSAQSHVYSIMDKIGPVAKALAHKYDEWEEWGLEELVESLRKYTDRNLYLKRLPGTTMSRKLWDRIKEIRGEEVNKCLCHWYFWNGVAMCQCW